MLLATWGPPVVCVYVYVCVLFWFMKSENPESANLVGRS